MELTQYPLPFLHFFSLIFFYLFIFLFIFLKANLLSVCCELVDNRDIVYVVFA